MASLPDVLKLRIDQRSDDRGNVVRLCLTPVDGGLLPPFSAGAHLEVEIPATANSGQGLRRQYSICSDPADLTRYELGVLNEAQSRGGSRAIHALATSGSMMTTGLPCNHFPLDESAESVILIAGGIGITPLLSMAYRLQSLGTPFEFHVSTRSPETTPFLDELKSFGEKVRYHHNSDGTRLSLHHDLPAPRLGRHLYVCGPERLIDAVVSAAQQAGYATDHVHREFFGASVETTGESFTVIVQSSGLSLTVGPDETIAKVLANNGIKLDVKCEEGVCGTCITDVVEGSIDHRDRFLTDAEKASNSLIAVCCSRARGRIILDL